MANATIVDLKWIVPISPDRNDTVIGTIQDVAKHLSIVDPEGFAAINESINEAVAAPWPQRPAVSYSSNDDPGMYDPTDYACGVYEWSANGLRIKEGIEYLRRVPGTPGMGGPGPVCVSTFQQISDSSLFVDSVPDLRPRELLLQVSHLLVQLCKSPMNPASLVVRACQVN